RHRWSDRGAIAEWRGVRRGTPRRFRGPGGGRPRASGRDGPAAHPERAGPRGGGPARRRHRGDPGLAGAPSCDRPLIKEILPQASIKPDRGVWTALERLANAPSGTVEMEGTVEASEYNGWQVVALAGDIAEPAADDL